MDAKNAQGFTPLQMAWDKGDMEMVKAIIDAGADVNVRWKNGFTRPRHVRDLVDFG